MSFQDQLQHMLTLNRRPYTTLWAYLTPWFGQWTRGERRFGEWPTPAEAQQYLYN